MIYKKALEGVVIVLVVLVLGIVFLNNSNNSGNSGKDSALGIIAPVSSEAKNTVGNSNLSGSEVPANTTSNEVGVTGETDVGGATGYEGVKGFDSFKDSYHIYSEREHHPQGKLWNKVDGHPTHEETKAVKKGEFLIFDVVYFDDNNVKHVVKTFKSQKEYIRLKDNGFYDYGGCFQYPNEPPCVMGKYNGGGFTIVENTPYGFGIEGSMYYYLGGSPDFQTLQPSRAVGTTITGVGYGPIPITN